MISIPDDLLDRLDAQAKSIGQTRSGFLQDLAEQELGSAEDGRRQEVERLLDLLAAEPLGGNAAEIIREARDSR
jgi:metal-responsive CopG/Arc/MetJ family transcriptional regulator